MHRHEKWSNDNKLTFLPEHFGIICQSLRFVTSPACNKFIQEFIREMRFLHFGTRLGDIASLQVEYSHCHLKQKLPPSSIDVRQCLFALKSGRNLSRMKVKNTFNKTRKNYRAHACWLAEKTINSKEKKNDVTAQCLDVCTLHRRCITLIGFTHF